VFKPPPSSKSLIIGFIVFGFIRRQFCKKLRSIQPQPVTNGVCGRKDRNGSGGMEPGRSPIRRAPAR